MLRFGVDWLICFVFNCLFVSKVLFFFLMGKQPAFWSVLTNQLSFFSFSVSSPLTLDELVEFDWYFFNFASLLLFLMDDVYFWGVLLCLMLSLMLRLCLELCLLTSQLFSSRAILFSFPKQCYAFSCSAYTKTSGWFVTILLVLLHLRRTSGGQLVKLTEFPFRFNRINSSKHFTFESTDSV